MFRLTLLSLFSVSLAMALPVAAAPMPVLPPLPPLPTDFIPVSDDRDGFYSGILGGSTLSPDDMMDGTVGLLAGHTTALGSLHLNIETLATAGLRGRFTIEAGGYAGFAFNDTISAFGGLSLGHDSATGLCASTGAVIELAAGEATAMRIDYRYNFDLSGEPDSQRLLTGILWRY